MVGQTVPVASATGVAPSATVAVVGQGTVAAQTHVPATARRSENDARNSNSIDRKPTHHTGDRVCSDDSYSNKNCSDSLSREAATIPPGGHQQPHHPVHHQQQQPVSASATVLGGLKHPQSQHHPSSGVGAAGSLASDPAQQPGGQLLTFNEIQLCSSLNMPVTRYLTLKTVLLSRPALDHSIHSVAENIVKKYLVSSGWLQTSPQN